MTEKGTKINNNNKIQRLPSPWPNRSPPRARSRLPDQNARLSTRATIASPRAFSTSLCGTRPFSPPKTSPSLSRRRSRNDLQSTTSCDSLRWFPLVFFFLPLPSLFFIVAILYTAQGTNLCIGFHQHRKLEEKILLRQISKWLDEGLSLSSQPPPLRLQLSDNSQAVPCAQLPPVTGRGWHKSSCDRWTSRRLEVCLFHCSVFCSFVAFWVPVAAPHTLPPSTACFPNDALLC